jgi:hypothetical protein
LNNLKNPEENIRSPGTRRNKEGINLGISELNPERKKWNSFVR